MRHIGSSSALALVAASAFCLGCDGEHPTAPLPLQAAISTLPMKGTYVATGTFVEPGACPGMAAAHSGGGVETHTGRYTITTLDCIVGPDFTGTFTKVAANGDLMFGEYRGTTTVLRPPPVLELTVAGTLVFTGGTGRFTGVSGSQTLSGRQTIDFTGTVPAIRTELELDGEIAVPHPN